MAEQRPSKKSVRHAAAEAQRRRERRNRYLVALGIAIVGAGVIVASLTRAEPAGLVDVETFADLGGGHLQEGDPLPTYNSSPATSGPHAPSPAPCGIYTEEVPDVVAVHNLEHGTVVVQYSPDVADIDLSKIHRFAREEGTHILVAPRDDLTDQVVLTAWTKMLRLETLDLTSVGAFYDRYAQGGPELGVPCPFQVDQSSG